MFFQVVVTCCQLWVLITAALAAAWPLPFQEPFDKLKLSTRKTSFQQLLCTSVISSPTGYNLSSPSYLTFSSSESASQDAFLPSAIYQSHPNQIRQPQNRHHPISPRPTWPSYYRQESRIDRASFARRQHQRETGSWKGSPAVTYRR